MNVRDGGRVLGKISASYSLGVVAPTGRVVYISGQAALDSAGNVVAEGDLGGQSRYAFQGMRTLLEEAGGSLEDVVKITTFVTDMTRFADFEKVRREVFQAPYPASSSVEVSGLAKPGLLVEIEAIAVI